MPDIHSLQTKYIVVAQEVEKSTIGVVHRLLTSHLSAVDVPTPSRNIQRTVAGAQRVMQSS